MSRTAYSARDYKLVSSFESVRDLLLQDRYRDRLSKPLAYWALPSDRRLPLAFLNISVGDLLQTPFDDLSATPGIGQKKISSLVKLLMRATSDTPPAVPFGLQELADDTGRHLRFDAGSSFNAFLVSEALWNEWTCTVRNRGLGNELIGRVADSLNTMPTVIWEKELGYYQDMTLSQIRGLRTHGEKRVRCVLEVYNKVHNVVQRLGEQSDNDTQLRRELGSPRILAITEWAQNALRWDGVPDHNDLLTNLAEPMLKQIEIDCGVAVYRIARQRLGIDGPATSVRIQAQSLGVTRARVYQLLDDCHKVVNVRWPNGKMWFDQLTAKLGAHLGISESDPGLFIATRQLCFPDRAQLLDGHSN